MPDYVARIEFAAPELSKAEFRRMRKQLISSLRELETAAGEEYHTPTRTVGARFSASAGSSSRAHALVQSTARTLLQRVRYIPLSAVRITVELERQQGDPAFKEAGVGDLSH
jgi:hypothetical protein